jgi:hypothetical protein
MDRKEIKTLLDKYGIKHILKESELTLLDMLEILSDLGYINLEKYEEEE